VKSGDQAGLISGSVEPSEGKAGESAVAIPRFSMWYPRLCRLRTEGLVPMSKYWMYRSHAGDMGPVSLVVSCQQKLDFFPLLHWLLWERSWVWTYGLDGRRDVDCVGIPSSRVQLIYSNLLMIVWKVATYGDRPQEVYDGRMWTGVGSVCVMLVGFPLQGVHRFESPWLSDMSNCLFMAAIK
jgi:hypothetical protein